MTAKDDIVVIKLTSGETLCATYLGRTPALDASTQGFDSIIIGNVGTVNLGRDRSDPTKLTYFLTPWQVEEMQIVTDKIVAIGAPNGMAAREYERVFRRIVTPDINEVAALQRGAHGKL